MERERERETEIRHYKIDNQPASQPTSQTYTRTLIRIQQIDKLAYTHIQRMLYMCWQASINAWYVQGIYSFHCLRTEDKETE